MSHAPCCCSVWLGRCGRCDLLVDLEGFRLVSAARRECALVLDRESCDHCAVCPGCGVTCSRSRSRARGGGDRRAQGRCCGNVPVAKYGAGCAENAPARSRPSSSRTTRCARPGRVWVCGRSVGRSDSCASREPPLPDWLDNWQPRGTPCGPLSSRACTAASDDSARFAGVRVPRVDERRVAPPSPTPTGPASSPASRPLARRTIPRSA